mgnify:CR=1 FL=1
MSFENVCQSIVIRYVIGNKQTDAYFYPELWKLVANTFRQNVQARASLFISESSSGNVAEIGWRNASCFAIPVLPRSPNTPLIMEVGSNEILFTRCGRKCISFFFFSLFSCSRRLIRSGRASSGSARDFSSLRRDPVAARKSK